MLCCLNAIEIDAKKNSCAWLAFEIIWQVTEKFYCMPQFIAVYKKPSRKPKAMLNYNNLVFSAEEEKVTRNQYIFWY